MRASTPTAVELMPIVPQLLIVCQHALSGISRMLTISYVCPSFALVAGFCWVGMPAGESRRSDSGLVSWGSKELTEEILKRTVTTCP